MTLGEKVKFIREKERYSQKEFAELLGFGQTIISDWEKNRKKPSYEALVAMNAFIKKHKLKIKLLED